ncbi:DNA polymerase III subunit delta [Rhizobium tumorigenes]|uniref:DNA polymerase III subunit delta n=1 Tax=Rhizobium tumorigenes TaxID=2041385 RepID=UPI00241C0C0A|nr:DNA polymerase III subunit delta [Rhizobium tumorigenes]WFS00671.1 DNA polymerase III subunit delta [Rhizobium tumorigenes]
MTEIKSHEFEGFLQTAARKHRLFVIYGPDRGLVSERAKQIAEKTGVDLSDPFSLVKLDVGDLHNDPGRLIDETNAIGLFGGARLVWIRGAANEKSVVDGLQAIASNPPDTAFLIVDAGDLKKTSALRKLADGNRTIMAIPCYADDARALNTLVDHELAHENLRITPAARHMLLELLGGDRIASRNEVRKLALYCRGLGTIDEQHVIDIIGDASAVSADDAVDAILKGDSAGFLHATQKIIASKTSIFLVLQGCLRQFQLLDIMRAEMDEKRLPATQVLQTHGRHLHFRRKPTIEQALRVWTSDAIGREMNRLQAAIFQTRQRQSLEDSIAMQTLLATTLQSARKA